MTTTDWADWLDDLGPAKLVHIYDPATRLRAIVAVDNVACGPSIGGVRMAPDVSAEEVFRLARAMTLKNAAAGLPTAAARPGSWPTPRRRTARRCAVRSLAPSGISMSTFPARHGHG